MRNGVSIKIFYILHIMEGALLHLVATGNQNEYLHINNTVEQYITANFDQIQGFNKELKLNVERNGDTIKRLLFNIKMNPAPQGYHYKQAWYNHFFKTIRLEIGGQTIFSINSEMLKMEHLIRGETNINELSFNYPNINERIEKSRQSHEVIVEPLKLSELIHSGIIRLVSLQYHELNFFITTSSLNDILEPNEVNVEPVIEEHHDIYIQSLTSTFLYQYLDTEQRRTMARSNHEDVIRQNIYNKFETSTQNTFSEYLYINNICSAMYIHITDRNNKEIPQQLISNIKIKLNNTIRFKLSGFHCRYINKDHMPHPTIPNNISQNLYYISYFTERNNQNGAENGINLSRIDHYNCEIQWINNVNIDINVHIIHRTNNILRAMSGIAGLRFVDNFGIREGSKEIFSNTEQIINIHKDELCMLTQDKFVEGTEIDYCNNCTKGFTTEMLKQWMAKCHDKKCVYCAKPYNNTTFKRGKLHLVD